MNLPVPSLRRALRGPRRLLSRSALPLLEVSLGGFAGQVIELIRQARRTSIQNPYSDDWRYPDGKPGYSPTDTFNVLRFIRSNADQLNRTAALFADDSSRDLLAQLLAFRALGPDHVQLPRATPDYMSFFGSARAMRSSDSNFTFPPFEIAHYSVPAEGGTIEVDCWLGNVIAGHLEKQYWFRRGPVTIQPEPGDIVIDAGACFGDTSLAFAASVGPGGQVHALEPVPHQRAILAHNLAANPNLASRIRDYAFATGSVSGKQLFFSDGGAGAQPTTGGTIPVETLSIDDLVEQEGLGRLDFIKMDVEGGETEALKGAAGTIRRFRPKLGISIYHSLDDLICLPQLVHDLLPDYELYLDHHTIYAEETILYARQPGSRSIGH
jgi:FkbM family methyltransferase